MLRHHKFKWWALIFAALLAANMAFAAPGFPDQGSQDINAACRGATSSRGTLRGDREAAVFTVAVTRDGQLQPNGTAILIDNTGIFLTAAHVVHFYQNQPIAVSQNVSGPIGKISRAYRVRVISDTNDWQKKDLVLLQAEHWDSPSIYPVPFRFDDLGYVNGFFIGHAENMDAPVFEHFTDAFRDGEISSGMRYRGTVFPHASGALLLDEVGRAFGMVLRHADFSNDQFANLTIEKLFRIVWERGLFSAFPLWDGLDKLKMLPPSPEAAELINKLKANGVDNDFLIRLQQRLITPPDMLHMIDAIFSSEIWPKKYALTRLHCRFC